MVQQILFLFKSPGWLLMALLTLILLLFLFYLILLIIRDLGLLPTSANLDLTSLLLTDLTFFLTLMVMFFLFRFWQEKRSLPFGIFTMKENS